MDRDQIKRDFDRDGFVVVRRFLVGQPFADLNAQLERYVREVVPTLPPEDAFYHDRSRPETLKQLQHMDRDAFFDHYRRDTRWQDLAALLMGEEVESQGAEWFNKPPGIDHPTPPHQDNYYFCLTPPNSVTLWLALDPVDAENGCLRYVPGSYREGIRPHNPTRVLGFSQGISDFGPADHQREREIHLEPGDLVAHHGETIHRADPNRSGTRQRRAFAQVFHGRSCRRDEQAFARYMAALNRQHQNLGLQSAAP